MCDEPSRAETQRVAAFYGVDVDTVEQFLRLPSATRDALLQRYDRWRMHAGLPAHTSPLARGMFRDMVRGDDAAAPAWRRTAPDGASEVLRVVVFEDRSTFQSRALGEPSPYVVQVTAGDGPGDEFIGLYDLDGRQFDTAARTWSLAAVVPSAVLEAIEHGWQTAHGELERI